MAIEAEALQESPIGLHPQERDNPPIGDPSDVSGRSIRSFLQQFLQGCLRSEQQSTAPILPTPHND
jgi:hypothetical protein